MGGIKDTWAYARFKGWKKRRKYLRSDHPFLADCRGVIHIGAHWGQERFLYQSLGLNVLWIEGDPEVHEILRANLRHFPAQRTVCALLSETDGQEVDFHVATNDGASSSVFEFVDENNFFDGVTMSESKPLTTRTFATLVADEGIDPGDYDALVMDVQGAELLVLRGMGDAVRQFRWLQLETSDFPYYDGAAMVGDLLDHLTPLGFREVTREVFASKPDVGACFDLILQRDH